MRVHSPNRKPNMRNTATIVLFALLALLLAGCVVTPVVTVTPAPGATSAPDNVTPWDEIQARGTLNVGTSADYPPFAFYDDTFRLTGFDPALARELGERLGVEVQFTDIPFEGLNDALQVGQIDMAIAAISVTPERREEADFTDVYFISEDAFLANGDAAITSLNTLEEMETRALVGVQKGSIYETWAQRELVDTGILPASNLLLYTDITRAVNDLERNRIDLVLLDAIAAGEFAGNRDVKIVAQGLNTQRYAMAVPKGADELRRALNGALDDSRADGTLLDLAATWLNAESAGDTTPTVAPTKTLAPTSTNTPIPSPTPVQITATSTPTRRPPTATPIPLPTRCLDSMAYVADLTYDDNNMNNPPVLSPGQAFIKSWRVRNSGTCTWDNRYRLAFVQGNQAGAQMGGQPLFIVGTVRPGQTHDLNLPLVAPIQPGTYQGWWQMYNELNQPFGQRIWVGIRVPSPITPTPRPTQTPSPQVSFTANRTNITAGQSVLFSWSTSNVREVYFYSENQNWWEHGVAGVDSRTEYPPRTMSYFLRVVRRDNTVDQREIRIFVEPAPEAPRITLFSVQPSGTIVQGECVVINWEVQGNVNWINLLRNGQFLWEGAPVRSSLQDCPPSQGNFEYRLEANGPGGTSRNAQTITVVRPQQPTATPTPTSTTAPQVTITQFDVQPPQMNLGECVSIVWTVGGDPGLVQIRRNGALIFDNAPFSGSGTDCPTTAGANIYRIDAVNRGGTQSDARERQVNVSAPTPTSPPPTAIPTVAPNTPTPTTIPSTATPTNTPVSAASIVFFNLSTDNIVLGECITMSWSYIGAGPEQAEILRNQDKLLVGPANTGDLQDCPLTIGQFEYTLRVGDPNAPVQEMRLLTVNPAP
jgi:polar amino acid transport system substrate-binding protein